MGFQITPHNGVNIVASDLTPNDMLVIHTNMAQWYLSHKTRLVAPDTKVMLKLDPEFAQGIRVRDLDLSYLTTGDLPNLDPWFADMTIDGEKIYRRGYPQVTPPGFTTITRQELRTRL